MRVLHIPLGQLRAVARACPGLLAAVTTAVEKGTDPEIRVLRVATRGEVPRWYLEVSKHEVLVLRPDDIEAMAAVVPIFVVDLIDEIRTELAPLFADGTLDAEVTKLIPFGPRFGGRGEPS